MCVGSIPASAGERTSPVQSILIRKVYPRECGGTRGGHDGWSLSWGLSPRVRGNARSHLVSVGVSGSIPASAGERFQGHFAVISKKVYPRECGGTLRSMQQVRPLQGLSPRVRGNDALAHITGIGQGSIPASAGERISEGGTERIARGLSPRVRGNVEYDYNPNALCGSIPASAGERKTVARRNSGRWVYPRECGGTEDCR